MSQINVHSEVKWLGIEQLKPGPYQTRKRFKRVTLEELAQSIATSGIVQPIIVRHNSRFDVYDIIAGERRWRAAQLVGVDRVPTLVRNDMSDDACLIFAIAENIQRDSLDPIEQALSLKRMGDELEMTHAAIAKSVGKSRVYVTNTLRLLQLEREIQQLLISEQIDAGHARALLALPEGMRVELSKQIVQHGLNVRQTERKVKELKELLQKQVKQPQKRDPNLVRLEQRLSDHLGHLATIVYDASTQKGAIKIQFNSLDECEGILDRLNRSYPELAEE